MKEIGGYFQLDKFVNKPYHLNMVELNTGRNALLYIIKAKKIKKMYIPYYLCSSISDILEKHLIEYEYYNIDYNFIPKFNKILKSNEYIYIVNYYGQFSKLLILNLKNKFQNIILDNTQSFFSKAIIGIDTIYSCRKYFGVPDGAYLSTDIMLEENLENDNSKDRMKHILGRIDGKASDYYNDFKKNDSSFKELELKKMSKLTKNILGAIDYEKILESRNKNFNILYNSLKDKNKLDIKQVDGPFVYPYYTDKGVEIRKKLIERNIYIPVLWPNILKDKRENSVEYKFAINILPLPCDQRYNEKDMKRILKELEQCIN